MTQAGQTVRNELIKRWRPPGSGVCRVVTGECRMKHTNSKPGSLSTLISLSTDNRDKSFNTKSKSECKSISKIQRKQKTAVFNPKTPRNRAEANNRSSKAGRKRNRTTKYTIHNTRRLRHRQVKTGRGPKLADFSKTRNQAVESFKKKVGEMLLVGGGSGQSD